MLHLLTARPRLITAALRDRYGSVEAPASPAAAVDAALDWLCRAQDESATRDGGGVARHYGLVDGWASSYPETTGYIVPTLLDCAADPAQQHRAGDLRRRARVMLDWLVEIQFEEGGFQGGRIDAPKRVPVIFNTGQILIGLARGVTEFGELYREATDRAAAWLVAAQDDDGCWRRFATPFAAPGEKVYETHVSWGLFEAARVTGNEVYTATACRNVDWALTHMRDNGWLDRCCLTDLVRPLTHTLGYALKGIVEAHRHTGYERYLAAATRLADGLAGARRPDGALPGRLDANWQAAVSWACLTGNVQTAWSWYYLYEKTGAERYREAADAAVNMVRGTMSVSGDPDTSGGVKGSHPIDGDYGRYEYLNWAAKFAIDAFRYEIALAGAAPAAAGG